MADPLISFSGIASGIDSKSIIAALVAFRSRPIDLLEKRRASFETLKLNYQALEDKVTTLRDAARDLATAQDLLSFNATSSNDGVLTASATGAAAEGSISVEVSALAKAEVEESNGFATFDSDNVGGGTIKITVGSPSGPTVHDIVLDPTTNTLEDVRDAINDADIGVTAQIINTGQGATPYELVVTGDNTGADYTVSIDTTTSFSGSLAFTQKVAAQNAALTVNGISFERASNTIDDIVTGLTFNLNGTTSGSPVTVTVSSDLEDIKGKIQAYVDAHNDLITFINSQIAVSEITGKGGPFNGESAVRTLKDQLLNLHGLGTLPGGSLSSLADVGITLGSDGTLSFDGSDFDEAAIDNLADVTALLTKTGDFVKDAGFQIVDVPDATPAGSYTVSITQAATKASGTAAAAFAGPLAQDETLTIQVGSGDPVTVDLLTGDTLSDAISKINNALSAAGVDLTASDSSGSLSFEADLYGSAYNFTVTSDVASGGSGVGSTGITASNGKDVAGTINGEAATGDGQVLTADDGTSVEGVAIKFTGTAPDSTTLTVGPDGFFVRVEDLLDEKLLPISGVLDARLDAISDTIEDIDDRIDSMEDRVEQFKESLERRFAALEALIGKLQASQSFLSIAQAQSLNQS